MRVRLLVFLKWNLFLKKFIIKDIVLVLGKKINILIIKVVFYMDLGIIISLIIGFGAIIFGFILEGGALHALFEPTAAIIVFGGTIGAVGVSFPIKTLKKVPHALKLAFTPQKREIDSLVELIKEMAIRARKEGLLNLEAYVQDQSVDPFIRKGLQMVVDGIEPHLIKSSLEVKVENMSNKRREEIAVFDSAGGFSPTMGIIGTVMGLVQVLGNLANPDELGPKIAVAFIATLYGVGTANLLWIPIANKLKALERDEILEKEMIIEGLLLIQEGVNPSVLAIKLESFREKQENEK